MPLSFSALPLSLDIGKNSLHPRTQYGPTDLRGAFRADLSIHSGGQRLSELYPPIPNRQGISCLPWGLLTFDRGITEPGMDRRIRPLLARRSDGTLV
jgi:hypothetical protein